MHQWLGDKFKLFWAKTTQNYIFCRRFMSFKKTPKHSPTVRSPNCKADGVYFTMFLSFYLELYRIMEIERTVDRQQFYFFSVFENSWTRNVCKMFRSSGDIQYPRIYVAPAQSLYSRNRENKSKQNLHILPKTFLSSGSNCNSIASLAHYSFGDWVGCLDSGKRGQ